MPDANLPAGWTPNLPCLVAATLLLCACATDTQKTQAQGGGAGAVLGALIGVAVGHDARAALIGGAIGGAAGLAVGDSVAQKKAQYARREDALRGSAARAQQLARLTQQENEHLRGDVARLDRAVESLRTQEMSAQARRAASQNNQRMAAALSREVDLQLQTVKAELARQQALLASEAQQAQQTKRPSPQQAVHLVEAGMHDLESSQRMLEEAKAQLQLIDPRRAY
jgi:Glycine zipper